jgi:hypothetical protein
MKKVLVALVLITAASRLNAQQLFFHESFDDGDLAKRGWYDNTALTIDPDVHIPNSSASVRFTFAQGAKTANGGIRKAIPESDEVYLSYWVRYSDNWTGSNKPYHPHEFHFMTNLNDKWHGPSFSHLTLYIEQNEGHPMLAIQDGENIDQTQIKVDLTNVTENRAVAGCNGNADGYDDDCYSNGNQYVNGKRWKSEKQWFSDESGTEYKGDWHRVEAYFKLNSIIDGKGIRDGIVRYWYDGQIVIDHNDVLLRTGQYPEMRFNQFLIAPYIGDGSPVEQSMWVDELSISASRPFDAVVDLGSHQTSVRVSADHIAFTLDKPSSLTLEAVDLLGRSTKLYHGSFPQGDSQIPYTASKLAPGLYHLLLRDNFGVLSATKVAITH